MKVKKIDTSRFEPDELAQYNALLAKGMVETDVEDDDDVVVPPAPAQKSATPAAAPTETPAQEDPAMETPAQKSAPSPELTAALADLANLKKSFEMKEMTAVAKKYAALGKKEDELAATLYEMKKSNEANYNAYIAVLDESLELVNKSGLFAEIGKSASGYTSAGGAADKADARAKEIMKSDNCDYTTALAKAWEDPALMAEADAEYFGK